MYYVTMTDRFMSNWGLSDGKTNKLVIKCETYEEAIVVEDNARQRDEMKYINICINKPRYDERYYYVSWHDKTDYKAWFERNYFRNRKAEREAI